MAQTVSSELAQTYRQIEALVMLTKCLPLRHPLPPMRGSAVSPDLALLLYELVQLHEPALVVECALGVSSLVLGYALETLGKGRLIAFEHDAGHAQRMAALVRRHRLERQVEIVHSALQEMRLAGEAVAVVRRRDRRDAGRPARAASSSSTGRPHRCSRSRAIRRCAGWRRSSPRTRSSSSTTSRVPTSGRSPSAGCARIARLTLQRIAHEKGTAILSRSR